MNMKPEELQRIWGFAGFKFSPRIPPHVIAPDGEALDSDPAPALDNWFKWVAHKLMEKDYSVRITVSKLVMDNSDSYSVRISKYLVWDKDVIVQGKDPAEALYQATLEVLDG
jgi:hypothetical protein